MATVVEHKEDGSVYVLLGSGFGAFKAMKPHWFMGNWAREDESGQLAMIAVCDFKGQIGWFRSDELRVLSVDGLMPEALLMSTPDS